MTHNQVAYFSARNDEAKNLETARHNKAQEKLSGEQLAATKEYNYLQAMNTATQLAETKRHNMASEQLQSTANYLQYEYNRGQLAIANANLLLAGRSQTTKEDTLNEQIRKTDLEVAQDEERIAETQRHNIAMEEETRRHNFWSTLLSVGQFVSATATGIATGLLTKNKQKKGK